MKKPPFLEYKILYYTDNRLSLKKENKKQKKNKNNKKSTKIIIKDVII